jgi:hypothetical protein
VYPELAEYLAEDAAAILARNLHAPVAEVSAELGDIPLKVVENVLVGEPVKKDGRPYQKPVVSQIWSSVTGLNHNPDLVDALAKREPGKPLAAKVCHGGVATLTGRIRGRVPYSAARNTPFQGLAADGAGLALFELVREGFRVVGFVHDELLVELPDEGGFVSAAKVARVQEVMRTAMESVLVGNIPVGCKAALAGRWDKSAGLVIRDGRAYPAGPKG